MRVFLSGGGSGNDVKEIDELFALQLNKNKPLLYIPIAIDNVKHPYSKCLNWLKSTFDYFGINKYEMCTEKELSKYKLRNPKDYAGIYIGGGNTPYLLLMLKKTGFWGFLKESLKNNIPIYGGSAGAIIFSKTIVTSLIHDKNWNNISDFSGMNIVDGYEISCHYSEKEKKTLKKIIIKYNIKKLIALTERNGLEINKNGIKLIGQEDALLFINGNERIIKTHSFLPKID